MICDNDVMKINNLINNNYINSNHSPTLPIHPSIDQSIIN